MFSELRKLSEDKSLSRKELAEKVAALRLPLPLAFISRFLPPVVITSIWLGGFTPSLMVLGMAVKSEGLKSLLLYIAVPLVFLFSFILIAGFWGTISKAGIIEGKFPRIPGHPIYALRRIYGAAWTQLFYFKPLYLLCLSIRPLKFITLRLFGYRGNTNMVIYPDTWLRDLPMIRAGSGVYLANRSTVGSNICLRDGTILVGHCDFEDGTMLGHLAIFGPDCKLGKNSELGVNAAFGIRVRLGTNTNIGPRVGINHATELGDNVVVGAGALIGMKCRIANGINIRPGASVPPGSIINTQEEADAFFSSEGHVLRNQRETIMKIIRENV